MLWRPRRSGGIVIMRRTIHHHDRFEPVPNPMSDAFGFDTLPFAVRSDLGEAYRWFWERLRSPGQWWTGAERIAIAEESRLATACSTCQRRKQSLSAYGDHGECEHGNDRRTATLPIKAIEAVHRIVTDQGRITQSFVSALADDGISDAHYVELLGIVVVTFSIDEFHRALGIAPEPLPEPLPGEPGHYRPELAQHDTGFVAMLPPDGAVNAESDLWPGDFTANVVRALTLIPDALRDWIRVGSAQYLSFEGMQNFVGLETRSINRMQMELIAGRVSAVNECFY